MKVEQIGGVVGYESIPALLSGGEIDIRKLPDKDREAMERVLARPAAKKDKARMTAYRLSWAEDGGLRSIEVDVSDLPQSVVDKVKTNWA